MNPSILTFWTTGTFGDPFFFVFVFFIFISTNKNRLNINQLSSPFLLRNVKICRFLPVSKRKDLRQAITPVFSSSFINQFTIYSHFPYFLLKFRKRNIRQSLPHVCIILIILGFMLYSSEQLSEQRAQCHAFMSIVESRRKSTKLRESFTASGFQRNTNSIRQKACWDTNLSPRPSLPNVAYTYIISCC